MKLSKQHQIAFLEAAIASIIGIVHTGAGIIITFGFVFLHVRFDARSAPPPQEPTRAIESCEDTEDEQDIICPRISSTIDLS